MEAVSNFDIVTVYREKLKFLYRDHEMLQDKFDLLFTTAKLMGYEFVDNLRVSNDGTDMYSLVMREEIEYKAALLVFQMIGNLVIKMEIKMEDYISVLSGYEVEKLIEGLDKILAYI